MRRSAVSRLVLCNTAARIGPPEIWKARIETVNKGGMASIVDGVVARWYTEAFRVSAPGAIEATRQMLLTTPANGYVASCAAVRDMDQRESISRITAPTLVIAGTHDPVTTPSDCRFLVERIGGARYVELDAAHLSNVEAPAAFTAALTGFLAQAD